MTIRPIGPAGYIPKITVDELTWDKFWQEAVNTVVNSPIPGQFVKMLEEVVPRIGAILFGLWVRSQGAIGRAVGESIDDVEKVAGPLLQEAAAAGLSDYFGTTITPQDIPLHAGYDGRRDLSDRLGGMILDSMFQQLESASELNPAQGKANAEAMIGFNLATALEGWMGGVLTTGFLSKFFPNWADLDDIVSQNLGFGRANRRVMGPLLTELIVIPFTRWIRDRFRNRVYGDSQFVRALYRGEITEDEYFAGMAENGWSREKAAALKVISGRLLEKEDIQRGLELGVIRENELRELFGSMGYPPDLAEIMRFNTIHDRVRNTYSAIEAVGRRMFRDGTMDESSYRSTLMEIGRSTLEVEAAIALGQLERSEVKAEPQKIRRVPRGTVERAFREGIIPRTLLEKFLVEQGYPTEDRNIMLTLQDVIKAKAAVAGGGGGGEEPEE